jgi:predicted lipoprotein
MNRALSFAPLLLGLAACSTASPPPSDQTPSADTARRALASIGACVDADALEFQARARALRDATVALEADTSSAARAAAQNAWRAAIETWSRLEVLQVGPIAPTSQPGGRDVRSHVYAWPLTSRCFIEQTIVSRGYASPSFVDGLVNTRGLGAIEYLLFYDGVDNACAATAQINTAGTWAAIGATELAARKRAYARAVAEDVVTWADQLVATWNTAGFGANELGRAGAGSTVYPTTVLALNGLSDALFYVEAETKDVKLAAPLGIARCDQARCPDAVESRYADHSLALVAENVEGVRRAFVGCGAAPFGLLDHLKAVGAADAAERMRLELDAVAAKAAAARSGSLRSMLAGDAAPALALHAELTTLTRSLKTDFVTILGLELPRRVEGDND